MKVGELYLTKTRIGLLRAVGAWGVNWLGDLSYTAGRRVTAGCAELAAAGLIQRGDPMPEILPKFGIWQLTDAGRDALAAIDREAAL